MLKDQTETTNADLAKEISRLSDILTKFHRRQNVGYSFLSGVIAGLGSVAGATIVFTLIVYLLGKINLIPIVGDWLGAVINEALLNTPLN